MVDHVPPGAGDDEVPVEVEGLEVLVTAVSAVTGDGQRGVPLLPVRRLVPQPPDGPHPGVPVGQRVRRDDLPRDRS
jgi:hypothetical protein